jgi:uncharacterized protein YdeI (YjbR/CyaY-like superfamily)
MATTRREYPEFHPHDRAELRAWLQAHHANSGPIWVIFDKKSARHDRLEYAHAVEEALCFGWIDSTLNPIDDKRYRQLFSPRKVTSEWSKLNKTRVAALIKAKRMMPAGKAAIATAKKNGTWSKIDHVESLVVPDDFAKALAKVPKALANFEKSSRSVKKMYLHRISTAVRPETRAKRIAQVLEWAKAGLRPGITSAASTAKKGK